MPQLFIINFWLRPAENTKTKLYFNCSKPGCMHKNPKENRARPGHILLEQFLRKGYKCEEIHEEDATIFIITHGKKNTKAVTTAVNNTYKGSRRTI